jgi:hypothetical protein
MDAHDHLDAPDLDASVANDAYDAIDLRIFSAC